jgi:hypothetical protein
MANVVRRYVVRVWCSQSLCYILEISQGERESNEDTELAVPSLSGDATTALFAVFDGHGERGWAVCVCVDVCVRVRGVVCAHKLVIHCTR